MTDSMDTSKAVTDWLNSMKQASRTQYSGRWETWLEYCQKKGLPDNGDKQLEDMKRRRQSGDNSEKYLYDNELPKFFAYLTSEFRSKITKEPLSENGASGVSTAVRSFFAYHRYTLEIRKESMPSSQKMVKKYEDHAFDIYQLRAMFAQGNLEERTVLSIGKDLWLRVGDFGNLSRQVILLMIQREAEKAEAEKRQPDIIEFLLTTEKEREPASCHLSRESIEMLKEYLRTCSDSNLAKLFPLTEDSLNDILVRLAKKAKITLTGRIRWHCLRKFGITVLHGKVQEPVMKFMVGKHITEDLRTYIQANNEPYKAFKLIEPLISLTKSNGNGNLTLAKELEEIKKERFKRLAFERLIEKTTPREVMEEAMKELAAEFGMAFKVEKIIKTKQKSGLELTDTLPELTIETKTVLPDVDSFIEQLSEKIEKKDLERVLKENGNGD